MSRKANKCVGGYTERCTDEQVCMRTEGQTIEQKRAPDIRKYGLTNKWIGNEWTDGRIDELTGAWVYVQLLCRNNEEDKNRNKISERTNSA